jgi:dienelactone hydrolase
MKNPDATALVAPLPPYAALLSAVAAAVLFLLLAHGAHGAVTGKSVTYWDGATRLVGYLAWDDALPGKRPGVVVLPEWWGITDYPKHRAEQLAALGYVAFAADIYGDGKTTDDPKKAGDLAAPFRADRALLRSRAGTALDVLGKAPQVDPQRLAAIGYCFGGTAALELARGGAPLLGVVSFHGGLDTPAGADKGKIDARVLALAGGADPFVPPKQLAGFEEEMRGRGADFKVVVYEGAVHAFTNPAADRYGIKGIGYDEKADRASWEAMKAFLSELFGDGKAKG